MIPITKLSIDPDRGQLEFLRINKKGVALGVKTFSGKEGDFYLMYSPSLNLSGYGDTLEEAEESFSLSLDLFCESIHAMNLIQRGQTLMMLGWSKVPLKNKNYSKSYIDQDGVLQNFDEGTVTTNFIEKAVA